jgi:outer membrane protein assembly factor BamB
MGRSDRDNLLSLVASRRTTLDDVQEADVIWQLDMKNELGVRPHNMSTCCVLNVGEKLLVCTSNGVDESHVNIPAPDAPSFMALDRNTGEVLWTDNSPGEFILHGQWSSPAYAELGGQPQVIFAGGDGWLYSFDPAGNGQGGSKLLWKFDCNPKESKFAIGGRQTRAHMIAFPCIYDGLVYITVGEDPEHGEGPGHLWCIDPSRRGDVSPELAFNARDPEQPIPRKRYQAVVAEDGDFARPNPNSAAVWHYESFDADGDGKIAFEEQFHRSLGIPVIKDDVLYVADFSGLFHCLDAKTGQVYWTYDMLAACWGSAVLVDDKVYLGDEDGDVAVFRHSPLRSVALPGGEPLAEHNLGNAIYGSPVVAHGVLYFTAKNRLIAVASDAPAEAP